MSDRTLTAKANGGLKLAESGTEYQGEIDGSNLAAVTSQTGAQHVIVSQSNVPKIITLDNLLKAAPQRWRPITAFDDQPPSSSTITLTEDLTSWVKAGLPVKFTLGGGASNPGTYYGKIPTVTSNLLSILGPALETDDGDLTALWVGLPECLVQLDLFIPGLYGAGAENNLMGVFAKTGFVWQGPAAHIAHFYAAHATVDSTTQPKVNVLAGGDAVSTNDSAKGVQLSTPLTWVANPAASVHYTYNGLANQATLNIACTTAGVSGDAEDLTVTLFIVLE